MDDERLDLILETEEDEAREDQWITTFADLSLLLLVFFILLFSMSTLDTEKFSKTFSSVTQALQGKLEEISTSTVSRQEAGVLLDQVLMRRQIIQSQQKVFTDVKTLQTQKGVEGLITANFEDGVITIRVPGDVLFQPGRVQLTAKGQQVIDSLKNFFIQHPDQMINIRGFTDNTQPGQGSRFKDNWEISAMRAVNVLRYLMRMGLEPNRMTATGLADLQPLYPNSTPEGRARNRRVEFILEKRVAGS